MAHLPRFTRRQWLERAGLLAVGGLAAACSPTAPSAPTSSAAAAAKPAPTTAAPAAANAPTRSAPAAAAPGVATKPFVFAVKTEAPTLDPNVSDGNYYRYPQRAIYEPLVDQVVGKDGKLTLTGILAEKWDAAADGKAYTFTLRKGVKFTDGSDLTADTVKWTFDRLLAQNTPVAGRLPALASTEVVDPLTVRFNLRDASAPFLASMTLPLIMSMTSGKQNEKGTDWGKAYFDGNPVGTGPYKLQEWVRGQQLTMQRNADYWRGWSGNHLDRIVLKLVKESATHRQLLETGDALLSDGVAFDDLDALQNTAGVVVEEESQPEILNICLHTQKPPFDNPKIRQAVAYAFDYAGFLKGVLNGRAAQPHGPIPPDTWGDDATLQPYTRNVETARQLMAEAGAPSSGLNVRIMTISAFGWYQAREAQILQQNLKDIGIDATIDDKADAATFTAQINDKQNGPNIYFYESYQALDDPDYELRRIYHSASQGLRNGMWYDNKQFDQLLDQAVAMTDRDARKPLYNQIQRMLHDDSPALWPASLRYYVTRRQEVQGYVWNPFSIGIPSYYDLSLAV